MSADLAALRAYVTTDTGVQNKSDSTVLLCVTHSNLNANFMELRFDRYMTIDKVKNKLQTHCGTNATAMQLSLKDYDGNMVAHLNEGARMLGYYSPEDGYTIHVVDLDPNSASANGWLEDVSKVEKYVMSDEDYDKREGSIRKWKQENLARDPTWTVEKAMAEKRGVEYIPPKAKIDDEEFMAEEAKGIEVGMRCEVTPGAKRGEVKFVGKNVEGFPLGWWIGVQFDEPVGKNDGSVKGVRFFECMEGYGSFQRPDKVAVGDYPEEDDPFADDEDEI